MSDTPRNILHTKFTISIGSSTLSGIFRRHLAPLTVGALVRASKVTLHIWRPDNQCNITNNFGIERARTSAPTVSGARWRRKIPLRVLDPIDIVNFVCRILRGVSDTSLHLCYLQLYYYEF